MNRSTCTFVLGVAFGVFALTTVGCKDDAKPTTAATSEPAIPTIGVPICDEYLAALYACMPKMTPEERATEEKSVNENLPGWRALSVKPANRAALEEGCASSLQTIREAAICTTK